MSGFVFLEDCDILEIRDAAMRVRYDGEIHWFPRSTLEDRGDHLDEGDTGITLGVKEFILVEKGIEVD